MSRTPLHIAPAAWPPEEAPAADPVQRDLQHRQELILVPASPRQQDIARPTALSLSAMVTQAAQRVRGHP